MAMKSRLGIALAASLATVYLTPLAQATPRAELPSGARSAPEFAAPAPARKDDALTASAALPQKSRTIHFDLETDPTAFAFSGYSLHAGFGYRQLRLDLGVYAMDVPGFVEPNDGFQSSFRGAGAKLQLFLFDDQKGGFVGVDGGMNQLRIQHSKTGARDSQWQAGIGVDFGWRFALPYGFYATPWLGLGYVLNAKDMQVAEKTYHPNAITIFPAVHVGYRFL